MMKKTLGEWNPLQFSGFGLKEKQAIEKWDRYTDKLESVKNKLMFSFSNGVSALGNKAKVLFQGMIDVGFCLGRFLTGAFRIGWKIADKLMYFGFGPAWSWAKNVVSSIAGIGKWILTTGWDAISFIGNGLKTIFSFGLDVIKTTSSYILGGAAKFFGWYFKNLFTTLFSPTMWLINIPIFVGLSFAIFSVFEGLFEIASGPVYNAVSKTFSGVIDKLGDFGSWLWEGAKAGFDWLVNVHFGDKTVKEYFTEFSAKLGGMIEPWVGSGSTFGGIIKWISETSTWLKGDFGEWYSKSASVVSSLIKYVKEMPGRTLVGKLFNKLEPYSVAVPFLGSAMHFIQKKYGFTFNGETKDIESALSQQKTAVLQSALERELVALKKSGKSDSYIKDEIQNNILPKLQESVYARVSQGDQTVALNNAYANSDRILAGKTGLVSNDVLKQRVDTITTLTNQLALINSGQIDYNDETKTSVRNALKAINLMNNNETSDRLKSANSGLSYDKEFADSTIADLKEFSSALEKSKQVPSYTDFLKNDPLDNLDSTQKFNVALAKLSTTTGNLAASAAKLPFVPFAYKVALGAGGLAIGAAGQTTLNKLDDAGITGRGGSQMNSRTDIGNFKAAGSTIKTGPDQASSLISQYLGT